MLSVRTQNIIVVVGFIGVVLILAYFQTSPSARYYHVAYSTEVPCDSKFDPDKVETISWEPRIFVYPNFLSDEECDHFISKGLSAGLVRSAVAAAPGSNSKNEARTSYGTFLEDDGDVVARRIESRLALWSQMPIEHGENFYLLRYEQGQQYKPHHDFFHRDLPGVEKFLGTSEQRTVTILMYLDSPKEGGETIFPVINLKVPAVKGTAVLFHSTLPTAQEDFNSLHGGLPVEEGTKWCLTKWIRLNSHHNRVPLQ